MKVETYYTVTYEPSSKEELLSLTTVLGTVLPMYDEIIVLYQKGFESDFCFSIVKEGSTVSWTDFNSMEYGEIRFEKLTSDILELVFSNV